MIRTAGELSLLRDSHPHITKLYMSVFKAPTLYIGQITGSPSRGARELTLSDVSGDITDLEAGHTLLIGTSAGDDDVSRRRLRSRAGQVITIDENSVVWSAGQFVTCIKFWEVWPVFPFIETSSPFTFYKDRDIAYSDQNRYPDPVAVAGAHKVAMLTGATVSISLDGSESYAVADGASISTYLWASDHGTIAAPSAATTTISFSSAHPDGVWLSLTVTDSNGKSHTTRRLIFVHTADGAGAPHKNFVMRTAVSVDWNKGGANISLDVFDDALVSDIQDRTLIIIWQRVTYNGTEQIIGDDAILFAGYISKETIHKNVAAGKVSFQATTPEALLRHKLGFSVSLVDDGNPNTWYKYYKLTATRAIHHLWHWHSTVLDVADVLIASSSILLEAVDDFAKGDLYKLVETFASQHGILAHVCSSKNGRIHVEIEAQMLNDTQRDALAVMMDITEQDRRDEDDFTIKRNVIPKTSFVMLSGGVYDGSSSTPIIAKAPGEVPLTDGSTEMNVERQALASQTDANERVGRVLALANAILTEGRVKFAGNYSFVDVAPQRWYTISIAAADTKRGITLTSTRLLARNVMHRYDPVNGVLLTDVVFDAEATGDDGIAGQYPTTVPDTYPDPDPPEDLYAGHLLAFNDATGAYLRSSWSARNGALSGANIQDQYAGADPWWFTSSKQATFDPAQAILWKCNVGKIYRSTDQGVTWTDTTPGTDPPNDAGDSPAPTVGVVTFMWYEGSLFTNQQHVFLARWQNGSSEWRSWLLITEDDGSTWSWAGVTA